MNLIQYVASYGDLLPSAGHEAKQRSNTQKTKVSNKLIIHFGEKIV